MIIPVINSYPKIPRVSISVFACIGLWATCMGYSAQAFGWKIGELAVKATATLKSTSFDYPFESKDEDMKKGDRILVAVIAVLIFDYFDARPIMDYYRATLFGWTLLILIQGFLCFFLMVCAQEAVQAIAQMRFDWKHRNEMTRDNASIVGR